MTKFAILQENTVSGALHYVQPGGFTGASSAPGDTMSYFDRSVAERDAETLRATNARDVERTKRKRKFKTHPCTYTVIEMTKEAEITDRWRNANGIVKRAG